MIDIMFWGKLVLEIIGGASIILTLIAPLTTNKYDDKVLSLIKKFLKMVSLHVDENKIVIDLKHK